MNFDIIWQNVRYLLLMVSAATAAAGWVSSEHAKQIGELASDAAMWGQIGGAVFLVGTWVWGNIIKWNTKTVPAVVAGNPTVPTVNPATGAVEPPEKFIQTPDIKQHAYSMLSPGAALGRNYSDIQLPYNLPAWKLRFGYSYITPYWDRIPARTSNKIADAVKGNHDLVLTKEDFDALPNDLWTKLRPYL
jgi:hypothetical protein